MLKYNVFMKRILLSAILLFTLTFNSNPFFHFLISQAHAQETSPADDITPLPTVALPDEAPVGGIDLTVSPVFVNLLTDPGKKVSAQIKIKNNSNQTEYLATRLAKFEPSADGSLPRLLEIDTKDEFYQWVDFSADQFTLAPNQTKTVTVSVTPAKTAGLGYYYGVIFQRIQEKKAEAGESIVTGAPAVSILLEVKSPHAKREIQLVDFTTDKLFYEYLPTTFRVKVKNTGNIHIVPGGDIFIDSMQTKELAILRFNEGRGNILPDSERTYEVAWKDAMILRTPVEEKGEITSAGGVNKYETTYNLSKGDKFRIGKYTANILLVYDNGERDVPLEATVSFWVIPWKILLAGVTVLLLAFLGLRSTITSWIRKVRSSKK